VLARFGRAYAADADELHRDVRRTVRQEFDGTSPSDPLTLARRQSAIDMSPGDAPEVVESFSDGRRNSGSGRPASWASASWG
jgi:hypothetical protein